MSIRWADGESERLAPPQSSYVEYLTKDGRSYYWNIVTGLTQWNRPHSSYIIPPEQSVQSTELFVFYIPPDWDDSDLSAHFQEFGHITSGKIVIDKETQKSKGFAFVTYENPVSAANAVQAMNGFQVAGKRLKVQFKKAQE